MVRLERYINKVYLDFRKEVEKIFLEIVNCFFLGEENDDNELLFLILKVVNSL